MIRLSDHFADNERKRSSEQLRQKQWFIKARQDREHREMLEDRMEENLAAFATSVIVATELEIQQFEDKLDVYDEAVIKALEKNRISMDELMLQLSDVDARIQSMLDRAYVMEDGRRVFLTKDRAQAFDEHGTEVTRDELDFDLVPHTTPTWEDVSTAISERNEIRQDYDRLTQERADILEFQDKVDAARDRITEGSISKSELDDLDAELADAVPPSVKAQTTGIENANNLPAVKSEFSATASPVVNQDPGTPAIDPRLQLLP